MSVRCSIKQHPRYSITDIFKRYYKSFLDQYSDTLNPNQRWLLQSNLQCRTEAMGGHKFECPDCSHIHFAWHSCNHRLCPQCGNNQTQQWVTNNIEKSLPVDYFMITFTLPSELHHLCHNVPDQFYRLFFKAASTSIKDILSDPKHAGVKPGFFGVFQSWQQNLLIHPHIHFIVPAVGITPTGEVKKISKKGWLVRGEVFAARLRTLMLDALLKQRLIDSSTIEQLWKIKWNCHVENFGNGINAIKYLGAYLFKGPVTNSRIISVDNQKVTFSVKDRKSDSTTSITITGVELIRRYLLHVLPHGFHRIRYYGFLHNTAKKSFNLIQEYLGAFFTDLKQRALLSKQLLNLQITSPLPKCPYCKTPMQLTGNVARAPPYRLMNRIFSYNILPRKTA